MSFLAQLRNQQSRPDGDLRLCYLIEIPAGELLARVLLRLVRFQHGHPELPGLDYQLRREHMHTPPPFLAQDDLPLLLQLLEQPQATADAKLLPDLVATGRCYLCRGQYHWIAVRAGASQPLAPRWTFDPAGNQRLHWPHPGGSQLFFHQRRPYLVHSTDGTLVAADCLLAPEAVELALDHAPLPWKSVAGFLDAEEARWSALGLPLPTVPKTLQQAARMQPELRLFSNAESDQLELRYRYIGEHYCTRVMAGDQESDPAYWDGSCIVLLPRDRAREQAWAERLAPYLRSFRHREGSGQWWSDRASDWRELLLESRQVLEAAGFAVRVEGSFCHHYLADDCWRISLEETGEGTWRFSVNLDAEGKDFDLLDLLQRVGLAPIDTTGVDLALRGGHRLWLSAERFNGLRETLGDLIGHRPRAGLPFTQLARLAELPSVLPEASHWHGDLQLLQRAQAIHQPPVPLPAGPLLRGVTLRDYQKTGVCWLQHLRQQGVNGLLADDMGLGKTLQAIAHLVLEKRRGALVPPALIVVPTSLLHNWVSEVSRFAPELERLVLHGEARHRHWRHLDDYDLLITSYALVVRDLEHWRAQPLSWLVLDEAQQIKNPNTRVSRALHELRSAHRLCISGTPVENHLGEIWSLFDFLMPGLLGNAETFKRHYRRPIEQAGDGARFSQLLRRITPFLLRRTKEAVASDLPPKTEIVQMVDMDEAQSAFYEQLRSAGSRELSEILARDIDQGRERIHVLVALTRLRQACCDPRLLGETNVPSAKTEHCVEMLQELAQEGRFTLVFSQFTSLLDLLGEELQRRGLGYLKLTGATRDRGALVARFQRGDVPVFLISLKAGGVGLNLTRADTVIHFDPWWNSAAERQATDRAHRIGQDKPVFVYRLICEGTIEERIQALQQHKQILGEVIGEQGRLSGEHFALKLEELLALIDDEEKTDAANLDP